MYITETEGKMSIITSISVKNDDWEFLRSEKLSPTALFNVGLARYRHKTVDLEELEGQNSTDIKELQEKVQRILHALEIVTESRDRFEAMYKQERNYRIQKTE